MNTVNCYISDYGTFEIPKHIFRSTRFEGHYYESIAPDMDAVQKGLDVIPVDRCPSNKPFFDWLSECNEAAQVEGADK